MRITVLGATGFVGRVLTEQALAAGHSVRVLVRDPRKLGELAGRLDVVSGDYFDPAAVREAVRGVEAVVSVLGPAANRPEPVETWGRAMEELLAALQAEGVRRFVLTGGCSTKVSPDETFGLRQHFIKLLVGLVGKHIIPIKTREAEILSQSGLDWVIVRPPRIVATPCGDRLVADERQLAGGQVEVGQLATFLLEQLSSERWLRQALLVASR